jgi:hypothetical protein
MRTLGMRRLLCAIALLVALPLYGQVPAIALLGIATGLLVAMILYEALRYADVRERVRHRVVQPD